jgi:hypothetical protein
MVVIEEFLEELVFPGDAAGIVGQEAARFLVGESVEQVHGGCPLRCKTVEPVVPRGAPHHPCGTDINGWE